MDIQPIIEQVRRGTYYWRQHAIQRSIERVVREEEVVEALLNGEIIEAYPEDGIRQRLQAAVARGLSRFVGRETECTALASSWPSRASIASR